MSQPNDGETGKFANWVGEVSEWQESAVGKLLRNINTKFSSYESILNDSNNKDIKTTLEKVKMVLENPVEWNVKILQKVIYDNLNDEDKHKFLLENKNKKNYSENDMFDWKFWKHMVEWTQKWLNIIENNLKILKNAQDVISENEKNNILWKVKTNIVADANSDPKNWFDNLPEWAEVKFKDDSEKRKLSTVWDDTEITLIVTANGRSEEITVNVRVVEENTVTTTPEATKLTAPEKITVNGEVHSIATEPPANKFWWALYYVNNWENSEVLNNTPDENKDREYLMQVNNETYKVKVDQNWNICPTAINMMSNIPVVMENSASGMKYIENKLPDALKGKGITIWWDWEDYTISLPWWKKFLTIEPMTIDWKWIWSLTDSLAFLNLTNYLRNSWKMHDIEFKNDNPDLKLEWGDLYVRVKKTRDIKWKKVKWLKVNKDTFWLPDNEELLKKYIKYNNGEDWNDNWDKKKNNDYQGIDLIVAPSQTHETSQGNGELIDSSEERAEVGDGDNAGGFDNDVVVSSGNAVDGSGVEGGGVVP